MDDEEEVTPPDSDENYDGSVSDTPRPDFEIQRQSSDNFSRTSVNSTSVNLQPNQLGDGQPEIVINDEAVDISESGKRGL